jgi:hypothetical protein
VTTPTVPQSNKLVPYRAPSSPSLDGVTVPYLNTEWRKLEQSIRTFQQVIVQLEQRLAAGAL